MLFSRGLAPFNVINAHQTLFYSMEATAAWWIQGNEACHKKPSHDTSDSIYFLFIHPFISRLPSTVLAKLTLYIKGHCDSEHMKIQIQNQNLNLYATWS